MRFFEGGPVIPDSLIEAQKLGKVVFVCGAGVSMASGLPSFVKLTDQVIQHFDPSPQSEILQDFEPWLLEERPKRLVPLDEIYTRIYRVFPRDEVDKYIAKQLLADEFKAAKNNNVLNLHTLSSSSTRNFTLVTTNFDRLLEINTPNDCSNTVLFHYEQRSTPNVDASGVVYLHGRLSDSACDRQMLLLSRSDFSQAYLLDSPVRSFFLHLLENYTVVFVGYSANDPLILYFFEGLAQHGTSSFNKPYIFSKHGYDGVFEEWLEIGIEAIEYFDYPDLWKTLGLWANMRRNSASWRRRIRKLLSCSPRTLHPFERSVVSHFLFSEEGASMFLENNTSNCYEWLCVFDGFYRSYSPLSGNLFLGESHFNPHLNYCLDEDVECTESRNQTTSHDTGDTACYIDFFTPDTFGKLVKPFSTHTNINVFSYDQELPNQLRMVFNWIARGIDNPLVAWWIIRRGFINKYLFFAIQSSLNDYMMLEQRVLDFWKVLSQLMVKEIPSIGITFRNVVLHRILTSGWDGITEQDFSKSMESFLLPLACSEWLQTIDPSTYTWDDFFVDFDRYLNECCTDDLLRLSLPPNNFILFIFQSLEKHFLDLVKTKRCLSLPASQFPTCYPDESIVGDSKFIEREPIFSLFTEVITSMSTLHTNLLLEHISNWPIEDENYFDKLRLFCISHACLYSSTRVISYLLLLPQKIFWSRSVRRELLYAISTRWNEMPDFFRIAIIDRFLSPITCEQFTEFESLLEIGKSELADCIFWLIRNGVELTKNQMHIYDGLPHLYSGLYEHEIPDNFDDIGIVLEDDFDPGDLLKMTLQEILGKTELFDYYSEPLEKRHRRFAGLVQRMPRKALLVLCLLARSKKINAEHWKDLFDNWPSSARQMQHTFLQKYIKTLPHDMLMNLTHEIANWLNKHFQNFHKLNPSLAWNTFDFVLLLLRKFTGQSPEKSSGNKSDVVIDWAINHPAGLITDALIESWASEYTCGNAHIDQEYLRRIEKVLSIDGEIGQASLAVSARRIYQLYYYNMYWTINILEPYFSKDIPNSAFAWSGFFASPYKIDIGLGKDIYRYFLHAAEADYEHHFGGHLANFAAKMFVLLGIVPISTNDSYYTTAMLNQLRSCLRSMGEASRSAVIWQLSYVSDHNSSYWLSHIIPFVESAWPLDKVCRTMRETLSWIHLLSRTGENFVQVYDSIKHFLVPINYERLELRPFVERRKSNMSIADKHPNTVLDMLNRIILERRRFRPYDMDTLISQLQNSCFVNSNNQKFQRIKSIIHSKS